MTNTMSSQEALPWKRVPDISLLSFEYNKISNTSFNKLLAQTDSAILRSTQFWDDVKNDGF